MCDSIANGGPRYTASCPPSNVTIASNVLSTTGDIYASNGTFTGTLTVSGNIVGPVSMTNLYVSNSVTTTNVYFQNKIGSTNLPTLSSAQGTWGSSANVSQVTVDQYGRVSGAANIAITSSQWTSNLGNVAFQNGVSIGTLVNPPTGSNLLVIGTATISNINSNGSGLSSLNAANLYGPAALTNLYVANSVTTTNITSTGTLGVTGAMTANVDNATFFFDTFTIPYINTQLLNVTAVTNLASLSLLNNLYTANSVTSTNVFASGNVVIGPTPVSVQANLHVEQGDIFIGNSAVTGTNFSTTGTVNKLIFDNSATASTVPNKISLFSNATAFISCGIGITGANSTGATVAYIARSGHAWYTGATNNQAEQMRLSSGGVLSLGSVASNAKLYIVGANANTTARFDASNIALVTTGGLVGFGTTNPSANLHVVGNVYASNALQTTNVFAITATVPGFTSQFNVNGGGTVTFSASTYLLWTNRVIVIPTWKNAAYAPGGYWEIFCPTSGTIAWNGGTATCTTAGIPINGWFALYYRVVPGSSVGVVPGNFILKDYTDTTYSPDSNWILLAVRNGDSGELKWMPGNTTIPLGGTFYTPSASYDKVQVAGTTVVDSSRVGIFTNLVSANSITSSNLYLSNGLDVGPGTLGTNVVVFANVSGGSNTFVMDSNGRIGIGTYSPQTILHIQVGSVTPTGSGSIATGVIISAGPSGGVAQALNFGAVGGAFNYAWIRSTYVNNSGVPNFLAINQNGGGVGIGGSTNPSSNLHVTGNIYSTTDLVTANSVQSTNVFATTANVGTLNVFQISNLNSLVLTNNIYTSNSITTSNLFLSNGLDVGPGTLGTNVVIFSNIGGGSNVFVMASNGYVGIGTTNPGAQLDIYSTVTNFPGATVTNSGGSITINAGVNAIYFSTQGIVRGYYNSAGFSPNADLSINLGSANGPRWNYVNAGTVNLNAGGANVYAANTVTTTNLFTSVANVGTLNVATVSNLSTLVLTNNLYAPNALSTTNLFVTNNIYAANSITTTNLVAAGFTSNSSNTVFNFDTLTIPFINSTTLNVASTANISSAFLTSANITTLNVSTLVLTNNLYGANALTTTNIFATRANVGTINAATVSNLSTLVLTNNLYVSNALSTTNVFATTVSTTNPISFRNRIINGDFIIDQRNAAASSTPGATVTRVIDRWKTEIAGTGRCLVGQVLGAVASPTGLTSYFGMRVTTTTTFGTGDYCFLSQVIEGINVVDLAWGTASAKTVTLGFWVYSSLTGTGGGFIRNSGETAGNYTRSYPFIYTISLANTWEYKTVMIPGDTLGQWISGQLDGVEMGFSVWNGSVYQSAPGAWAGGNFTGPSGTLINWAGTLNSNLYLTGVQFESGPVATPFERRHLGFELAQCQRYFEPSIVRVGGYHTANGNLRGSVFFNAKKRPKTAPTFSIGTQYENTNLGGLTFDNSNFDQSSARWISNVVATGDAYGQWKVTVDCEF